MLYSGGMHARENAGAPGLTTAQLAERTGIPAPTLRMWQSRHGFPAPTRSGAGHQRYSEADVERVRAVVAGRAEGLSLAAAIARVSAPSGAPPPSLYAGIAQRRPELQPMTLGKPAMLALTRALEDDYCAHAGAGVLVGSFQRVRFYRQSERRWRELARTARAAVALADFKELRRRPGHAAEVPVSREHPLAREWALIFHLPGAGGCLAGWEIPSALPGERGRRYEALWSPEPQVALEAIGVAAGLLEPLAPALAGTLARAAEASAPAPSTALRSAVGQAHRMISYLGSGDPFAPRAAEGMA